MAIFYCCYGDCWGNSDDGCEPSKKHKNQLICMSCVESMTDEELKDREVDLKNNIEILYKEIEDLLNLLDSHELELTNVQTQLSKHKLDSSLAA